MERIKGVAGGAAIGGSRAKPAAASGFTVAAGAEAASAAPAAAVQPAGLAGMLALQEAEAETAGNRNGRRHGQAVLDALQDLQLGLLDTAGGTEQLTALMRLAEQAPSVIDPGLADVLGAIRLRAKIELLRRGAGNG